MQNDDYGPYRAYGIYERGEYDEESNLLTMIFNTKEGAEKYIREIKEVGWVYTIGEVIYQKDY